MIALTCLAMAALLFVIYICWTFALSEIVLSYLAPVPEEGEEDIGQCGDPLFLCWLLTIAVSSMIYGYLVHTLIL